ncbi:AAA family ATPase [Ruegeria pomeroyi]|uniref:endopeptidase La n=1 Tax=Ruegeria alba TaxID=2916756 RepID=A0ABS9P1F7_9RHOB|nr:ATP-binding protein [Ruegeria alba]MCE8526172.1 AAA family ATPase [Ruegeria pomeroyi]MCE8534162.1 AAA family ATPase [Ruegeria pomeroyi]MCG6560323.1 AAA family ATPase [Ruegeria alba]
MATRLKGELSVEQLRRTCDPASLVGAGTEQTGKGGLVGQERALRALKLAVEIRHEDFNLFVLGPQGTGRHTTVEQVLRAHAATRETPCDWVYVNNFDAPHKPVALKLPVGLADRLKVEMEDVIDDLAGDMPALFESEEYQAQRRAIEESFSERHEQAMADFAERAREENTTLIRTPMGFMVAATKEGNVLKSEEFKKLPEDEQTVIEEKVERFQNQLSDILRDASKMEREHRSRVEALNAEMAERAVSSRIGEAESAFGAVDGVSDYLFRVRKDMIENPEIFLQAAAQRQNGPFPEAIAKSHLDPIFRRYLVNVIVSHDPAAMSSAPVVVEDLPSLERLAGRIEHISQMGSLVTDFSLIRPGALHLANGGYLLIDARRILAEPYAWDALKRCLKKRSITITSLVDRMSLFSTTSLEPEPIPLDVRVVLVGDRRLHSLLVMLDPEFSELFKVQADFEGTVTRSGETLFGLASVLHDFTRKQGLLPLTDSGAARLLDEATRLAGDARKLTLQLGQLTDLLREAEHYARSDGHSIVSETEIARAVGERERRASRVQERFQEAISRQIVLVDTEGTMVGQINGLSVVETGTYRFGRPSRITARVRMGAGKLIDIEREVELGGALHSKGVMILGGYLTSTYALDAPFSLHASLVFEQSYGGVDGDSASCAELIALLSALSGRPVRQDLAITGSVNQLGEVQAIGGVNEKIEGFFDVCAERGLTGNQGVIIPASNIEHLMLRDRVVEAVGQGRFRIIPIRSVDEGVEIMTGRTAGARVETGEFPDGSVNAEVEARLRTFARDRRAFSARTEAAGEGEHS